MHHRRSRKFHVMLCTVMPFWAGTFLRRGTGIGPSLVSLGASSWVTGLAVTRV